MPGRTDFVRLQRVLRAGSLGQPQLVVDVERLDRNLERVRRQLGPRALRIAVKSLPCPALVERVLARSGSDRLMAFDAVMLRQALECWPAADVLLGKPLPIAAATRIVQGWPAAELAGLAARVHWLVDTAARVRQYAALAASLPLRLGLCVELDVGMHRGGAGSARELDAVLEEIAVAADHLELRGFMGYDAHCARLPLSRGAAGAARAAARAYRSLVDHARRRYPRLVPDAVLLDGAGSPTFALLDESSPVNDVAIGSVLVKPADFDLPSLAAFEPAAWIAAPVLKDLPGVRLPFLEWTGALLGHGRRTLFLYGGRWMAHPAWPPGLATSRAYGLSSNQQFMTVPIDAPVATDDYVFLRPTQSEAVLAQFGFVTAVHGDDRVEYWPAFLPGRIGDD